MAEHVEVVIKIPKYYLKHPQDYTCLAECVRRGTPLPEHHGRLIDADYVINHICESKECYKENCKGKLYMRCMDIMWVDNAPTIIEEVKADESNV